MKRLFASNRHRDAPIKAILDQWQQQPEQVKGKKIWLLWGGRKKEDLFWQPETTLSNFTYIPVLTREDEWQGAKGYVQEIALQQPIHWQKAQVYACGSEVMIQSAQKAPHPTRIKRRKLLLRCLCLTHQRKLKIFVVKKIIRYKTL